MPHLQQLLPYSYEALVPTTGHVTMRTHHDPDSVLGDAIEVTSRPVAEVKWRISRKQSRAT
jgi:hypothetical protein